MATDRFSDRQEGLTSPASRHWPITPDDDNDCDPKPRAIRIGTGGNLVIRDEQNNDVTYVVADGEVLPFRPKRIMAAGTDADNIVGWD